LKSHHIKKKPQITLKKTSNSLEISLKCHAFLKKASHYQKRATGFLETGQYTKAFVVRLNLNQLQKILRVVLTRINTSVQEPKLLFSLRKKSIV
jgi:hypothetical protein